MKSDDHVIVETPEYFQYVPKLLDATPKHVLANYLGLHIATELGRYTGRQFKNISDQYAIERDEEVIIGKLSSLQRVGNCMECCFERVSFDCKALEWQGNDE